MTSFQQSTAPKASKFLTRCIPEMNSPWAQPHAALMDPSAGPWGTSGSHSHAPSGNAALRPAPEPEGSPQEPRGKVEAVQKSHRSGVRLWAAAQPCSTASPVPVPPAPSTGPAHRPGLRPEGRVQRRRFSSQAFPAWLPQRFSSHHLVSTSWPSVAILTTAPQPDATRSVRNCPSVALPLSNPFPPAPCPCFAGRAAIALPTDTFPRSAGTTHSADEKSRHLACRGWKVITFVLEIYFSQYFSIK